MSDLKTRPITDAWVVASWEEYIRMLEDPLYEKAKGYYYKGHMRLEMSPVSFDHGKDHVVIIFAVNLFAALKGIPVTGLDATTFRKPGVGECQPDVSYYIGDRAQSIPAGTGIINLEQFPAPDLVIEVANTSLLDDVGSKRTLYEELGVAEYWVIDHHHHHHHHVQNTQILAYAIADQGSKRIQVSQVLPELPIALLEAALHRSRETDQSQVGAWLLAQF